MGKCLLCLVLALSIGCATRTVSPAVEQSNCSHLHEQLAKVEQLTGRKFTKAPGCRALSKLQYRDKVTELIARDTDPVLLRRDAVFLKRLKAIPDTLDVEKCLPKIYASASVAFFDDVEFTLFVPAWFQTPKWVILHELIHGSQTILRGIDDEETIWKGLLSDLSLAKGIYLEGEALYFEERAEEEFPELFTYEDLDPENQLPLEPSCANTDLIQQLFSSQYAQGRLLVRTLVSMHGPASLDQILLSPPSSTRQVLKPEEFEILPPESYRPLLEGDTQRLGQLFLFVFLNQELDRASSLRGSFGLTKDTLQYSPADGYRWELSFDKERDVWEAFLALSNRLRAVDVTDVVVTQEPAKLMVVVAVPPKS